MKSFGELVFTWRNSVRRNWIVEIERKHARNISFREFESLIVITRYFKNLRAKALGLYFVFFSLFSTVSATMDYLSKMS